MNIFQAIEDALMKANAAAPAMKDLLSMVETLGGDVSAHKPALQDLMDAMAALNQVIKDAQGL